MILESLKLICGHDFMFNSYAYFWYSIINNHLKGECESYRYQASDSAD